MAELADAADLKSAGPSRQEQSDPPITNGHADDLALRLAQTGVKPSIISTIAAAMGNLGDDDHAAVADHIGVLAAMSPARRAAFMTLTKPEANRETP